MAGTKRKSIEKTSTPSSSKKNKSTPVDKDDNKTISTTPKRKLEDTAIVNEAAQSIKKSNRQSTPSRKVIEQQEQSPIVKLTTAEQRQKAIEWAAQSLPNLRKSPKTPASSKKVQAVKETSSSKKDSPEPNSKKSPEKTISNAPAVNTPVPKVSVPKVSVPKVSGNTAQKRTRVKKENLTITTTNTIAASARKDHPLPVPGTQGFVFLIPSLLIAFWAYYYLYYSKK